MKKEKNTSSCQIGAKYEFSNDNKEWVGRVYLGRLSGLDTGVMIFLTAPISEPITGYCLPNGFLWTKAKKVKRFTYIRMKKERKKQ